MAPFFDFRCGYCKEAQTGPLVALTPVPIDPNTRSKALVTLGQPTRYHALVHCSRCLYATFLDFVYRSDIPIEQQVYPINPAVTPKACFPEYPEPKAAPEIPTTIAAAFLDAQRVFNAGVYPATLAACCTTLDLLGAHYSIGGTLSRIIDGLQQQGLLIRSLADWAHTLRVLRNEAIHAGMAIPEVDARECLEFTTLVLELLFVLPARVERLRSAPHSSPA